MDSTPEKNWLESILSNQKTAHRFTHFVISMMMVCVGGTISQFGARLDPSWNSSYLVLACFLVALESILTHQESDSWSFHKKMGFRIAEWMGILTLLRFLPYLTNGFTTFEIDLRSWQTSLINFFSTEYMVLIALSIAVWLLSAAFSRDLEVLNASITDLSYEEGKLDNSRGEARQHIIDRALIIGVLLSIITVGARLEVDALWGERPLGPSTMLYLLVYFILTLILLSLSHFAILRGQWLWNKISLSPTLARSWFWYASIFLILLTTISLLLPTTYSLGFLESLKAVLDFIWSFFLTLISLATLPIRWLWSLIDTGARFEMEGESGETPPLPEVTPDAGVVPWLEVLKSIIFWAIILGLLGYTLWFYLRRIPAFALILSKFQLAGRLNSLWNWLRSTMRTTANSVGKAARSFIQTLRSRQTGKELLTGSRFNFRRASPRQQVVYFYLRLLDKASSNGITRRTSQTPTQFEHTLVSALQEVEPEVHGITEAFLEARYSPHNIEPQQTGLVMKLWKRIMQAFRHPPKK